MIGHTPIDKGPFLIAVVFFLIGATIVGFALMRKNETLRLLALYTAVLFAAALSSPMVPDPVLRWQALSQAGGGRYFFFPMLVYLWSVIDTLSSSSPRWIKRVCLVPVCLLVVGLGRWFYKPFPPRNFDASVERFDHAAVGESVHVPINPVPWEMVLVKH